ncbi:hypothetical protein ACIRPH_18305 [Nocardiopsis sp. NPDC101807]|uniref:hypothetical protein n=1 Tax=Nocardiopsis sp. NPDC101807 TaxID=3364339 RepID=UPI0037FA107E
MDSSRDDTALRPSGICRRGHHDWKHDAPGAKRKICTRCRSMSMTNYCDCAECQAADPDAAAVGPVF